MPLVRVAVNPIIDDIDNCKQVVIKHPCLDVELVNFVAQYCGLRAAWHWRCSACRSSSQIDGGHTVVGNAWSSACLARRLSGQCV